MEPVDITAILNKLEHPYDPYHSDLKVIREGLAYLLKKDMEPKKEKKNADKA